MAAYDLEKNLFVGTSAAIDLGVDVSRAVIYTESGYVSQTGYQLILALVGVSLLGSYIGKVLLQKIDQENFRRIVLLLILAVGITVLVKAAWPLLSAS